MNQIQLPYVLLYLCSTFLSSVSQVLLKKGAMLEATGYLYVTIFGVTSFHEKMNPKKIAALVMIVAGILVYAL